MVQSNQTIDLASSEFHATLTSYPVQGNILVLCIGIVTTYPALVSSITETGVTWTKLTNCTASNIDSEIWLGRIGSSAGKDIDIVLTTSSGGYYTVVDTIEWSGLGVYPTVDQTASNSGSGDTYLDSGNTATTTNPNELWVASLYGVADGNDVTQAYPINGFTLFDGNERTNAPHDSSLSYCYKIVSSVGNAHTRTTLGGSSISVWRGCIVTLTGVPPNTFIHTWNSSLPIQVTVNGTLLSVPITETVYEGDTFVFNASSTLLLGGSNYYTFDHWLFNGTTSDYTNLQSLYLDGNSTFVAVYSIYFPVAPSGGSLYYFRSDVHTVNNVTAYDFDTSNTASKVDATSTDLTSGLSVTWGFRVFILHTDATVSEVTSDYVGQITRNVDGSGYLNNTWSCPSYTMSVGFDSLEVRVYTRIGSGEWTLKGVYTTPRLKEKALKVSTWLFNVRVAKATGSTISTFSFGHSSTANSTVSGVQFVDPNTFDLMMFNLDSGNFFTFLLLPYTALIGGTFYGLLILLFSVPVYIKYRTLDIILFMLVIFGGAGGFFSLLMPTSGLQIGFFVMAFGLGALIYKVFK